MRAAAVLVALLLAAGAVDVSASSAAIPKPAIRSLTASPQTLPSSGGTVVLSARVQNATRCTIGGKTVACTSGRASVSVTVPGNTSQTQRSVSYVVRAIGAGGASVQRSISVTEAAPIAPVMIAANALPQGTVGVAYSASAMGASGGTPPYTWSVVSGALPAGLTLSSSGTITGTPTAAGQASFTVQAADSAAKSTTAPFSITVAPAPLSVSRSTFPDATVGTFYSTTMQAAGGTPPYTWSIAVGAAPLGTTLSSSGVLKGTPTSAGLASFTVRVTDSAGASATAPLAIRVAAAAVPASADATSGNWSGYYLEGSGFTGVSSTFTVPNVSAASTNTDTSEWIGIDGVSNANLIQAGVTEDYSVATNQIDIYAWWEILPAPSTRISAAIVSPSPGDRVSISIGQQSVGLWSVRVSDDTIGQVFTISLSYNGPLTSAEWIVEAATSSLTGDVLTLGQYAPNVVFTSPRYTGNETSTVSVQMVQGGVAVSTPSALSANGFSVAYGSSAPSPP